jgi:hypothetical protein
MGARPSARFACVQVIDQRRRRDPMNQSPVLQHESHPTIRFNDLLRRPEIRRETCVHRLYVLRRAPLPAFRVEICWLSVLCGDVDHRSQFAETIAVNWATDGPGGLDLRLQRKVWGLVGREADALSCGCGVEHRSRSGTRLQRTDGKVSGLRAGMCCGYTPPNSLTVHGFQSSPPSIGVAPRVSVNQSGRVPSLA